MKLEVMDVFAGGGEMGEIAARMDWSRTPLGPVETWSQSLRTAVNILLTSRFSMWMGWGSDIVFLYNDGYRRDTIGKKHPWAFGRPAREVWAEIWTDVYPRMESVLTTGVATWDEALLLFLERSGYPEETYHTFSYSAILDDDGARQGIFCVVMEETGRVIGQRRLDTLRELASDLATTRRETDVLAAVERQLARNLRDLPFVLIYLCDETGGTAMRAAMTGFADQHEAAPPTIHMDDANQTWPLSSMILPGATPVTLEVSKRFESLPQGDWNASPTTVALVPLSGQGSSRPIGFMVAGLNPFREFDNEYAGFINLVAVQIAGSVANARAYEEGLRTEARERVLRLEAEGARREAENTGARLREVFTRAPACIATLRGPDHIFESANPLYLQLIGMRDVLGKPVAEALPEVVSQGFVELLDHVYSSGEPFLANEMQIRLDRTGSGDVEDVYLNFVYQPLYDLDGSVSGILAHAVDVTDQVRARHIIEEQAQALEDRTAEAEAARADAEEANLAKSRFLATMSHELRTPLNAILGYSDLLDAEISGPLTDGQRTQLQRVDAAARHLLRLIDEILTFSRIEAGREEVRLEYTDVSALVRETASMIDPLMRAKHVAFECSIDDGIAGLIDVGKVRQILLNLLSNAVKFTDRGSVTLGTALEGSTLVIRVRDTGIGIPASQQERVFEPFKQVDHSATRTAGGTGLGLSVTRELARMLGGDVSLVSASGEGSEFTVRMPLEGSV